MIYIILFFEYNTKYNIAFYIYDFYSLKQGSLFDYEVK